MPDKLNLMECSSNNEDQFDLSCSETIQKRKRDKISPDISEHHKKYIWEEALLLQQNKYYLPENSQNQINGSTSTPSTQSTKSKIPPIYVYNASNYKTVIEDIKTVITSDDFTTQCKSNAIRINLTNTTDFRKLTAFYDEMKIQYHTFSNPDDSVLSVVIRNMPLSISVEEIKEELAKTYPVKKVTRLLSKDKFPMPLCVVDLEPDKKGNEIFNLTKFDHSIVSVEPRRKTRDIPQCTRCQRFGHTKNYCKLQPRCVKCSQNHHYLECPKRPGEMPTCVNCGANHTANYRGCPYYTDLKTKINTQQQRKKSPDTYNRPSPSNQQVPNTSTSSQYRHPNNSRTNTYATAVKNEQNPITNIFESILNFITPYLDQIKQFICSLFTSMFNGNIQHK